LEAGQLFVKEDPSQLKNTKDLGSKPTKQSKPIVVPVIDETVL
jgi:hypothetical protein